MALDNSYRRQTNASTQRKKAVPKNTDMIYKHRQSGARAAQSFLAKTNVPFNNNWKVDKNNEPNYREVNKQLITAAGKSIWQNSKQKNNLNTKVNTTVQSRFDLWVTEVNYGFAAVGQKAVSKYYSRHYPKTFNLTPVTVTGVCANEDEYDDLANFIREGQIALSYDSDNVFRLFIPSAKIDCIGSIDSFRAGFVGNNGGVPLAPQFSFDFIIFKDLKDNIQSIGSSARNIINKKDQSVTAGFFNNTYAQYSNDYVVGQLIDDINAQNNPNLANLSKAKAARQAEAAAKKQANNKALLDAIPNLF